MMTENVEKQIEKQIGCMSGFLHIFDRQQILSNKRIYSTKRLPPSTSVDTSPESVKSVKSSPIKPVEKIVTVEPVVSVPQSPDRFKPSPGSNNVTPPKSPLPFPLFETKEGTMRTSWKFCKEMPRLSLDSRATTDSKGGLCPKDNGANSRSPSVIARLMGLEQLPSSDSGNLQSPETVKKPELRRSASESRVSRDLFNSRFVEGNGLNPNKQPVETNLGNEKIRDNVRNRNGQNGRGIEARKNLPRNQKSESQWRSRSFFDSGDFFPEPKQSTNQNQMCGDSEKLLKMRGIDDRTNDLESLKHILEALQLKGLLHSKNKRPLSYDGQRNFVYDQSFMPIDDSNNVVMKPWLSGGTNQRFGNTFGVVNNRYSSESIHSPKKEYGVIDRSGRSPVRSRNSSPVSRSGNSIVKRKPLSIETQRSFNESTNSSRRNSPVNSPKLTPRRNGSGSGSNYQYVTDRSPRHRRPTDMISSNRKAARNFRTEDESSSFSESSGSTTSQSDPERPKTEYKDGKSLLARCDKLLNSIAEMNTINESHTTSNSVLPSPVSVLDSVFDINESSSPSPVMKRNIDFKDVMVDMDDDIWNSIIFSSTSTSVDESEYDDSYYTYISDILRASRYIPDDSSVYYFLEKEKYGNDASKSSKAQRKLVFDAVIEILDQQRELPPWNADSIIEYGNCNKQVYSEFLKIREPETADNVLDLICIVLKRDLARSNGWGDRPIEISESVLYIERLIFKDLICETIQDLAKYAGKSTFFAPRRKLVF
uniref:uncharacterized protein LOC122583047 n=1 Tax=Erigeron canadensis TaxID=72917 RepID=UPI001CB8AEB1|nr:uncharacterized protein LOC122583047 [Erigeron canadensis]